MKTLAFLGLFFLFQYVDLQEFSKRIPPQKILTKDSVTVAVDAVIYARIFNGTTISIENVTKPLAATTLRNIIAKKSLSEVLNDQEQITDVMKTTLADAMDPWGVNIQRVEVNIVQLPGQKSMAASR